eukprot:jgi/Mesen1/10281/ME000079S09702
MCRSSERACRRSSPFVRIRTLVPLVCLGELVISNMSRKANFICGTLQGALQRWILNFASRRLLSVMVVMNPHLSSRQQDHLLDIARRLLEQLLWQRSVDPRVIRGILAVACPNQKTALLFSYLVDVMAGLVTSIRLGEEPDCGGAWGGPLDKDADLEADGGTGGRAGHPQAAGMCDCPAWGSAGADVAPAATAGLDADCERGGPEGVQLAIACSPAESDARCVGATSSAGALVASRNEVGQAMNARREELAVVQLLRRQYCLDTRYIAAMPPLVRRAVAEALWGGSLPPLQQLPPPQLPRPPPQHQQQQLQLCARPSSGQLAHRPPCRRHQHHLAGGGRGGGGGARAAPPPAPPPTCSITLEPLVLQDGAIVSDVVAVVHGTRRRGRVH